MLATNTVATVHQRLRDEHALAVGISSFRRFVASEFPDESLRDRVTVLRPDVAAGEEALCGFLHRISSPAGWSISTVSRPLTPEHASQCGRRLPRRSWREKLG